MIEVDPKGKRSARVAERLREIAKLIANSKNIVAIAGAGISTDAGIPDYRDRYKNGIPLQLASLLTESGRTKFWEQATSLRDAALPAKPTETHYLFRRLQDEGKLLRLYTQNVDGLEAAAGLRTVTKAGKLGTSTCMVLHGDIKILRCQLCCYEYNWKIYEEKILETSGIARAPFECLKCQTRCDARVARGMREIAIGQLYPGIMYSDGEHPEASEIQADVEKAAKKARLLMILGTSLNFSGPRTIAKDVAKAVQNKGGKVIYVNETKPRHDVLPFVDYWVNWKCDAWSKILSASLEPMHKRRSRHGGRSGFRHQRKAACGH